MFETILAIGYNGRIRAIGTFEELSKHDEEITRTGNGYSLFTHHVEIAYLQEPKTLTIHTMDDGYLHMRKEVEEFYRDYGKFGDFGDVIYITKYNGFPLITAVGRKVFRLPAIAADALPIVTGINGRAFYLGITRGENHKNKGQIATVGGFMDIVDHELESAPACLVHELLEEIGLEIRLTKKPQFTVQDSPFPETAEVEFDLLGERGKTNLNYLGTFYSSAANLRPEFKTKRVHAAAAYVLPIFLRTDVTEQKLRDALIPQDKKEGNELFVWPVALGMPNFGPEGHRHMYNKAIEFYSLYSGLKH